MSSNKPLSDVNPPNSVPGGGATLESFDLLRRRSVVYEGDWDSLWNKITNDLELEERGLDEIKYREGVRNQKYYEGDYFWRFNEETGETRDLPHTDSDPFFPHNWFRYFADLSIAASLEANPDIVIDPSRNDEHNILAAKEARRLGDYLERELLTEDFKLASEKLRQLYGGVWWYSYFSKDAGNLYVDHPMYDPFDEIQQQTESAFHCACGEMGPTEIMYPAVDGMLCPGCMRKDQLEIFEAPQVVSNNISGYERERLGFPVVKAISPLQMKGDRRGPYGEGQYVRRRRLVDKDVVAEAIPWWDPKNGGGDRDDIGIRAEEIARRGSMVSGFGSVSSMFSRERNDIPVAQWWLQPAKYGHIMFSKDIHFIGSDRPSIPARVPLGELFPKGIYKLKVGGRWLDHRPEDFRKHWLYIPYIYEPHKSDGGSLKDMCEPQREIIHMRALLFMYLIAKSGGGPTLIKSPLSDTDFDGSPQTITKVPAGYPGPLGDLFFQPQYPPADPNLASYTNQMVGEMQIMSQTVSPNTTGDPAAMEMGGTSTARGMMIMNAKVQGLMGPKLMPLAFAQAQAVMQWINLFKENIPEDEIPIPLKGKTGSPEWGMIKRGNLEGDFIAYPRVGSWIPRPREEKQAALQNCFSVFGQLMLDPNAPRNLKEEIKTAYGLEVDLDDYDTEIRDAMLRIDQMNKMVPDAMQTVEMLAAQGMIGPDPETGEPPDPMQLAGQVLSSICPIDEDLDDPQVYLVYFRQYLRSDDARYGDPIVNAALRIQWKTYQQMIQQSQEQEMMQQIQLQQMLKGQDASMAQEGQDQKSAEDDNKALNQFKMKMLEKQGDQDAQARQSQQDSDNRIKEKIAEKSLEAALATGQALPAQGKATVKKLGSLPSQPAM